MQHNNDSHRLSLRYEAQLFDASGGGRPRVVPVLVVTGFLGSGKTTLVAHLLAAAGRDLKLGVLVNEVAALDVDGQLLSTAQSNAAAGIKSSAQLAGGCACCSVSSNLAEALQQLAGSSSYQQLDYLLLETSGVADVEPLAAMLSGTGFKLAGVVTVVDAEAGTGQLADEEVALAQLRAADVVVVNKCDLAGLSVLSGVEDLIQDKAPGVRMLRARFGQVPPEALLDIDVEEAAVDDSQAADTAAASQQQSVQGEIAFLSHEPVVSTHTLKGSNRSRAGPLVSRHRTAKLAAAAAGDSAASHSPHSHSHSSFVSVSFHSSEPLCMACFQAYVANSLLTATGLFRAKGFVFFSQQRSLHYVFHVSGKQRAECGATGSWQGPPGVQLVLIGQDQQVLVQLKAQLQACVASCCSCGAGSAGCSAASDQAAAGLLQQQQPVDSSSSLPPPQLPPHQQQQQQQQGVASQAGPGSRSSSSSSSTSAAAVRFAQLVEQHHRFKLYQHQQHSSRDPQQPEGCAAAAEAKAAAAGVDRGLVEFTTVGSALHGVIAEEVNSAVLRKASATTSSGLLFMCHMKSPPALRTAAASNQQVAYQGVLALQLCFRRGDTASYAEQQWQQFEEAVAPVLRKAYQHVHNCKCDVVQLMEAAQP